MSKIVTLADSMPFLLYEGDNKKVKVKVLLREETIWLSINGIAELFDTDKSGISRHIANIYDSEELAMEATVANFATVQTEGGRSVKRDIEFYNLDAIIAVGYRVNSKKATQFRIWATQLLKEYIKKGYILDDERLKQGKQVFGKDYFEELLERIRSIRASERRIYQKITDIFAECCNDYDPKSDITRDFYGTVQNKFHYAITGKTAPEIIYAKADKNERNMGLMTWKNAPKGRILASDVTIAKNYLSESEIKKLERTISSFFDHIELMIERRISITMKDMAGSVDKFLAFNEYSILSNKGLISREKADKKALEEYGAFNKTQKIESDFDKLLKEVCSNVENA